MRKTIEEIITNYKLDVEGIIEYKNEISINCISIEIGSNEGYYVKIQEEKNIVALRFHDKDCVIKTLKVMLVFF